MRTPFGAMLALLLGCANASRSAPSLAGLSRAAGSSGARGASLPASGSALDALGALSAHEHTLARAVRPRARAAIRLAFAAPPTPGGTRAGGSAANALQLEAEVAVAARGARERALLPEGLPLVGIEHRARGTGGFGGGARKGGARPGKAGAAGAAGSDGAKLASEMRREGVARVDAALPPAVALALQRHVDEQRALAEGAIAAGSERASLVADLVLNSRRCDLLLDLAPPVLAALAALLGEGSVLGPALARLAGPNAVLHEVACLFSDPGSAQQPLHPDTPFSAVPPLFACFVALQDVDAEMGPTLYLPGTHTAQAHAAFYGTALGHSAARHGLRQQPPVPEPFLRGARVAHGTLRMGDAALYDQTVLHCGSANRSDRPRRQFYVSFINPSVPGVAARPSMLPGLRGQLTLAELRAELPGLGRAGGKGGRLAALAALAAAGVAAEA